MLLLSADHPIKKSTNTRHHLKQKRHLTVPIYLEARHPAGSKPFTESKQVYGDLYNGAGIELVVGGEVVLKKFFPSNTVHVKNSAVVVRMYPLEIMRTAKQ